MPIASPVLGSVVCAPIFVHVSQVCVQVFTKHLWNSSMRKGFVEVAIIIIVVIIVVVVVVVVVVIIIIIIIIVVVVIIVCQVVVDVPRTAPGVPFFAQPQLQKSLERILFLWGIRCAGPLASALAGPAPPSLQPPPSP